LLCRYYAQQRATDAITASMVKDEFKRQNREARERQAELQLLEELYSVGNVAAACLVIRSPRSSAMAIS